MDDFIRSMPTVASVIGAQHAGESDKPRIRYSALRDGLRTVAIAGRIRHMSIHMPRIGTGQAGGSWEIISDIIQESLVDQGLHVTVYDLPGTTVRFEPQIGLDLF